MYKLIIVGGGFGGLVLANRLLDKGFKDFLLLERNDRLGKKILVTGNGRCNLTNVDVSVSRYHGDNAAFCASALERFGSSELITFFAELGLVVTEEGGRFYPLSRSAASVLDCLRLRIDGAPLPDGKKLCECESKVVDIRYENGRYMLTAENGKKYQAENVVLAFGGKSGANLGTDGSGFLLAEKLGYTVTKLTPSLVQLKTSDFSKSLSGVKHKACVTLYDGDRFIATEDGDFLFVDGGVSGNAVFELSSRLSLTSRPQIKIDFIPNMTREELSSALMKKVKHFGFLPAEKLLVGYVHSALSAWIASRCGVKGIQISELTASQLSDVIACVKNCRAKIDGAFDFKASQVTHGGVSTKEVDEVTFSGKKSKGLYIVGEALDVDGDCGGFNLQWAFSSAMAAAENFI